jgi:anti-sigma factor RsiW
MCACAGIRKRLNAYIDGELPTPARNSVERHLVECEPCRMAVDDLRALKPYLHTFDTPPVPVALASRILSEASSRQKRRGSKEQVWLGWRALLPQPWFVTGATTAALIVGLVMGAWMGWTSYRAAGSGQYMAVATKTDRADSLYAFDVLSAEPDGSIEASALAFLENGK